MDFERTTASHNSPSALRPSPLDWLLRLRLRAGGSRRASVLVGAGLSALVYAVLAGLLSALALDHANAPVWLVGAPGKDGIVVLFASDAAGGLAIGVVARRHALLIASVTGLVLQLPRLVAALGARAALFSLNDLGRGAALGGLLLGGLGLVVLSVGMWLVAAELGSVLATRRLDGLGLR